MYQQALHRSADRIVPVARRMASWSSNPHLSSLSAPSACSSSITAASRCMPAASRSDCTPQAPGSSLATRGFSTLAAARPNAETLWLVPPSPSSSTAASEKDSHGQGSARQTKQPRSKEPRPAKPAKPAGQTAEPRKQLDVSSRKPKTPVEQQQAPSSRQSTSPGSRVVISYPVRTASATSGASEPQTKQQQQQSKSKEPRSVKEKEDQRDQRDQRDKKRESQLQQQPQQTQRQQDKPKPKPTATLTPKKPFATSRHGAPTAPSGRKKKAALRMQADPAGDFSDTPFPGDSRKDWGGVAKNEPKQSPRVSEPFDLQLAVSRVEALKSIKLLPTLVGDVLLTVPGTTDPRVNLQSLKWWVEMKSLEDKLYGRTTGYMSIDAIHHIAHHALTKRFPTIENALALADVSPEGFRFRKYHPMTVVSSEADLESMRKSLLSPLSESKWQALSALVFSPEKPSFSQQQQQRRARDSARKSEDVVSAKALARRILSRDRSQTPAPAPVELLEATMDILAGVRPAPATVLSPIFDTLASLGNADELECVDMTETLSHLERSRLLLPSQFFFYQHTFASGLVTHHDDAFAGDNAPPRYSSLTPLKTVLLKIKTPLNLTRSELVSGLEKGNPTFSCISARVEKLDSLSKVWSVWGRLEDLASGVTAPSCAKILAKSNWDVTPAADAAEERNVLITNLPSDVTRVHVQQWFRDYYVADDVSAPISIVNNGSTAAVIVRFANASEAKRAIVHVSLHGLPSTVPAKKDALQDRIVRAYSLDAPSAE